MSNIDISDKEAIIKKLEDMQDQIDELKETMLSKLSNKNLKPIHNMNVEGYTFEIQEEPCKYSSNIKKYDFINKNYKVINDLKRIIKISTYNQKELANLIGVNEQTMSNIVNNRFTTSLEIALKISYALDIPVNNLFKLSRI